MRAAAPRHDSVASSRLQRERGFVLFELLMVISIIGVLATIVFVPMRRTMERWMLDQYARQMKLDFEFAQEESMRLRSGSIVQFDRATPGYRILVGGVLVRNRTPPGFIKYKWNTIPFFSNYMLYDAHGRTTTGGQLVLTNSYGDIRNVILYMLSGQIRITNTFDAS
jgi:prepilin-type N-terminal cleavage/methylation domain-containing protein